jgi:hypothetical protein
MGLHGSDSEQGFNIDSPYTDALELKIILVLGKALDTRSNK